MGKPVAAGMVKFLPVDGAVGRPAVAAIAPDGTYDVKTLADSRGLVPGQYLVTAASGGPSENDRGPGSRGAGGKASHRPPMPLKSGLKLTVKAEDRTKIFDIALDEK